MIKCENGRSEIKGNVPGLLSEYTVITRHIREVLTKDMSEEFAMYMLKKSFDLGMMSDDEVDKEFEKTIGKFSGTGLAMMLSELFGGGHNAD